MGFYLRPNKREAVIKLHIFLDAERRLREVNWSENFKWYQSGLPFVYMCDVYGFAIAKKEQAKCMLINKD